MARAYSLDLRERVVAAVASGQSCPCGRRSVWPSSPTLLLRFALVQGSLIGASS
jgi:hypothetical protein